MKQSTFSAVMATNLLNVLQEYTKGIRFVAILTLLFTIGVGSMWGAEYDTPFTITSDAVVSSSGYTKYTYTDTSSRGWIITHGGNNKSVGTNSSKRNSCKLTNYSKYAVSPVTTSSIASAFVSTTSLTDIGKISYTFNGGKNQTSTKVYLIYSSDNNTFSQISLSTGTQDATISSGTSYTFAKKTGYFGLLFVATNSSGDWRIDDVEITFYKEKEFTPSYTVIAESNNESWGTVSLNGTTITATPETGCRVSTTNPYTISPSTSATVEQSGNIFTVTPSADTEITINFEEIPTYTVNWYVNGTKEHSQTAIVGTTLTDIPNLEKYDCNGKKFVGWTTISDYVDETDAPYDLIANTAGMTIPEGGEDYYAVFANSKTTNDGSSTKEYSFTITKDDFTTTSYADNNKSKKSTATATDGSGATFNVTWKSNQVYQNSGMQWQKGTGYIYNETNLGSISSVTVQSTAGTFKTFYGDEECPSSGTTSGKPFFKTYETNVATGKTSEIIITFTQTTTGEEVTTFSNYSTTCIPPEEYTIKWMVNGELYAETIVIEGNTLAPPTINEIPTACGGRVFRGWTESETVDTDGLGINYVDESTIPDEDKTYYAVFAKAQGSSNGDYVKVESTLPDWSGEYLIVYEKESKAFNGSLTALDASNNTINVEISNNSIKSNPTNDAAIFTIVKMNESGGYSIKSKSGYYIGYTSNDKGLDSHQTTQYLNTIAFGKGWDSQETESVVIRSQNGQMLLYNSAADRFRYYGSAQGYIALYCKSTFTDYTTVCIETYEVSFDMNGHGEDQKPNAQIVEKDQKAEAPTINDITGYKFGGWYIEPACTTAYDFNTPITADITLYAKWTATCITITWNPNYSATSTTSTYTYDGATIELPIPVRTGYTFVGWFTEPSGGTQIIEVGTTNKPTSDVEYFAHWEANTYQVVFNANTGEGGAMDNQSFTYDVEQKLTANTYTKFGHTFAGWATTADGEKVYDDRHSVSNLTATDKAIVTLYAVWTELPKFTVTWRVNGEETLEQVYQGYKVANPPAIATPPCGDIFVGWTIENYKGDAAPTPLYRTLDEIPAIEGDKTFYAVFADYAD